MDLYRYPASVLRVVDGDTVYLRLKLTPQRTIEVDGASYFDFGFRHYATQSDSTRPALLEACFRLSGINAPEVRGPERDKGLKATEHLIGLLMSAGDLEAKTEHDEQDKWGRYLATLYAADGWSVNRRMIDDGQAKEYRP